MKATMIQKIFSVLVLLPLFSCTESKSKDDIGRESKIIVSQKDVAKVFETYIDGEKSSENREVYFLDTENLALFKKGIVLRARYERKRKRGELTVKIRPWNTKVKIPDEWSKHDGLKCEIDQTLTKETLSCSIKEISKDTQAGKFLLLLQTGDLKLIMSSVQRGLVKLAFPDFDFLSFKKKIRVYGPVPSTVWKNVKKINGEKVDIELWQIGQEKLLEISTKGEKKKWIKGLEDELKKDGVHPDLTTVSKTKRAMDYFRERNKGK